MQPESHTKKEGSSIAYEREQDFVLRENESPTRTARGSQATETWLGRCFFCVVDY